MGKIIRTLVFSLAKNGFKSVISIFCCSVSVGNIILHFQTFILPLIVIMVSLLKRLETLPQFFWIGLSQFVVFLHVIPDRPYDDEIRSLCGALAVVRLQNYYN